MLLSSARLGVTSTSAAGLESACDRRPRCIHLWQRLTIPKGMNSGRDVVNPCRRGLQGSRLCRAQGGGGEPVAGETGETRLKQTMEDLDAILGIDEEEEEKRKEEGERLQQDKSTSQETSRSFLDKAVEQAVKAEADRIIKDKGQDQKDSEVKKQQIFEDMMKVIESATKMAGDKAGQQEVRESVENLIQTINPEGIVTSDDIKILREKVFLPNVFWVTEVTPTDAIEKGVVVRGNLRGDQETVFRNVVARVKELFGDKYEIFLIEDTLTERLDGDQKTKVAFQIAPSITTLPEETAPWQLVFAGVLLLLTIGSAFQLGLSVNLAKLPKETLEWLARPENFNSEVLPPGLNEYDVVPFLLSAFPVAGGTLLLQFLHEMGHWIAAFIRKIKLGPPFLIPYSQIGTFGSVTQLKSLARNRRDLWDVSFAGPAFGGMASLGFLIAGLLMASDPEMAREALVPVPTALLQGSLLIGGVLRAALGQEAVARPEVLLHPLTIAGWCGLTTTALNLLPVGNIDGGRIMLSAWGQKTLTVTSIFTYAGLGLGLLGSSLSLPFGLYVLICQRTPEQNVQDTVTPPGSQRQTITVVFTILAVLILLPLGVFMPGNGVVEQAGTGGTFM